MKLKTFMITVLAVVVFAVAAVFVVFMSGNTPKIGLQSATGAEVTGTRTEGTSTAAPTPVPTRAPSPVPTIAPKTLTVVAVGDIMLGRKVGMLLEKNGKGYEYSFEKVAPLLKKGDVVFGNLESPVTASTKSLSKAHKIILKCSPEAMSAVKYAGFNLISIANNHMMDYYDTGLLDTVKYLQQAGIAHAGGGKNLDEARKIAIVEKNGLKYGVIAYSDMVEFMYTGTPSITYAAGKNKAGIAPRKLELILADIARVRSQVDILAVSLHWGVEESFTIPDSQVQFAHKLIDAGADVILGHHPHQFQGIEVYKNKPIIYSMGNFLFDQNDPENQESFILNMNYKGKTLDSFTATPVRTLEKYHIEVQTGKNAAALLAREASLSSKLGTDCEIKDDKLVFTIK